MPNATLEIGGRFQLLVALDKVTERKDVTLDRASKAGNKIARREFDSVTGEEVTSDEVLRGVFTADGFRAIDAEAIEAIEAETKLDTFEVEHFVPLKDVPFNRATAAYMLRPQKGQKATALAVIHKALKQTKKAGVFKLCLTKRQYLAVLYAENGGLMVNILSFASDFTRAKRAAEHLEGATVKSEVAALAVELIESLSTDASVIDSFEDDLPALKQRLVDEALAGKKIKAKAKKATVAPSADEDALYSALRESLAEIEKQKGSSKGSKAGKEKVPA